MTDAPESDASFLVPVSGACVIGIRCAASLSLLHALALAGGRYFVYGVPYLVPSQIIGLIALYYRDT